MIQRGVANPRRDPQRSPEDFESAVTKKFKHMQTSFQRESLVDQLKASDGETRKRIGAVLDARIADLKKRAGDDKADAVAQLQAWQHWKVQFEGEGLKELGQTDTTRDFFAWLLGKGKEEEHRRTPWYRDRTLLELADVREWIDGFQDILDESRSELIKLAYRTPHNLDEAWLYYKYIVHTDWMQKEDRFFWVDLVNLMADRAALGGGLTNTAIQNNQPRLERTAASGQKELVPLTQNDVWDPSRADIIGRTLPETETALRDQNKIIDLSGQLAEISNANNLPDGEKFDPSPIPVSIEDAQEIVEAVQVPFTESVAAVEEALEEIASPTASAYDVIQAVFVAALSSMDELMALDVDRPMPDLPAAEVEAKYDVFERLSDLNKELGAMAEMNLVSDIVPASMEYQMTAQLLGVVEKVRGTLEEAKGLQGLNDKESNNLHVLDRQMVRLENSIQFRLANADGLLKLPDGTSTLPMALALLPAMKPPNMTNYLRSANANFDAVLKRSRVVLPEAEEKKLRTSYQIAGLVQEFTNEMNSFRAANDLNETAAGVFRKLEKEQWKLWVKGLNQTPEEANRIVNLIDDPAAFQSLPSILLQDLKVHSSLFLPLLLSQRGPNLQSLLLAPEESVLEGQRDALDRWQQSMDAAQVDVSQKFFRRMDEDEKVFMSRLIERWNTSSSKTTTEQLVEAFPTYAANFLGGALRVAGEQGFLYLMTSTAAKLMTLPTGVAPSIAFAAITSGIARYWFRKTDYWTMKNMKWWAMELVASQFIGSVAHSGMHARDLATAFVEQELNEQVARAMGVTSGLSHGDWVESIMNYVGMFPWAVPALATMSLMGVGTAFTVGGPLAVPMLGLGGAGVLGALGLHTLDVHGSIAGWVVKLADILTLATVSPAHVQTSAVANLMQNGPPAADALRSFWASTVTLPTTRDLIDRLATQDIPIASRLLVLLNVNGFLSHIDPAIRALNVATSAGLTMEDALNLKDLPNEVRVGAFVLNALRFTPSIIGEIDKLHRWSLEEATRLSKFSMDEMRADLLNRRAVVRAMQKGAFLHQRRLQGKRPQFAKRKTRFKGGEKVGREEEEEIYE